MSDLSDLLRYGRGEFSSTGDLGGAITSIGEREQALLNEILKYDPNAKWDFRAGGPSSNEGGGITPDTYVLDFDHTKLPSLNPDGTPNDSHDGKLRGTVNNAGQYFGTTWLDGESDDPRWKGTFHNVDDSRMLNPELAYDTPYGRMTDTRNMKPKELGFNWGALAPGLISLLAALPTGGASLLTSGFFGGANAFRGLVEGADPLRTIGNFASGFLPGMVGIPPGLASQLASLGIRTAVNGGRIDPTQIAMLLARNGLNSIGKP